MKWSISATLRLCKICLFGTGGLGKYNNVMEKKFKAYLFENGTWDDININNLAENVIIPFIVEYKETPIPHDCLFVFKKDMCLYVIPMQIGKADPRRFVSIIKEALDKEDKEIEEIEYSESI